MTLNGIRYVVVENAMQCTSCSTERKQWLGASHNNQMPTRLIVFQYSLVIRMKHGQFSPNFTVAFSFCFSPRVSFSLLSLMNFSFHTGNCVSVYSLNVFFSLWLKSIKLMTLQRKITTYFSYALSLCTCTCTFVYMFNHRLVLVSVVVLLQFPCASDCSRLQ